jgi:acyl-CoA synthetase (AMP-forming)/AMP-acid ligase II
VLLHDIARRAARERPGALALICGGRSWSFAQLEQRTQRLACALGALAPRGARIALLAENRPEGIECYYGVPRAAQCLVLLNYRLAGRELAQLLADCGAEVLIGERALLDRVAPHAAELSRLHTRVALDAPGPGELAWEDLLERGAGAPEPARGEAGELAWIIYTSGTTGRPKGAMLTHANLVAGVLSSVLTRPIGPDERYLYPFPLCHISGHNLVALHFCGLPVVLLRRFEPAALVEAVLEHRVTSVSLAPTMLAMLIDDPALGDAELPSLRSIRYGASSIPAELLRRAMARLRCDFWQGYGMTELAGNVLSLDAEAHRRGLADEPQLLRAAGRPSPLVDLRIVDADGRELPDGSVGELAVRGDQVFAGYWNDPTASADALRGGWLLTGDVCQRDREGFYYVLDRKKDLIITGGENVASREVEDVLHLHASVREAAVIGIPDPRWGESICAVVALRPGHAPGAEALIAHVREHLAGYKKPRRVMFVDALPRNAGGKVLKAELRERLGHELAGKPSWARSEPQASAGSDEA